LNVGEDLTKMGRSFHNLRPAKAKSRSPLDLRPTCGIVNRSLFEDLIDIFALLSSTKYSGAISQTALKTWIKGSNLKIKQSYGSV